MTPEFDGLLHRLRRLSTCPNRRECVKINADEARVLVAALDTWREALTTLGRDAVNEQGSDRYTSLVVADAFGIPADELRRLVGE